MTDVARAFEAIREPHAAWIEKNFPGLKRWMPVMGMLEEAAEMEEAKTPGEVEDAIGDVIIFSLNLVTKMGVDCESIVRVAEKARGKMFGRDRGCEAIRPLPSGQALARALYPIIGKLQHHYLKMSQRIRGDHREHFKAISVQIGTVWGTIAAVVGDDEMVRIVEETWQQVAKRDWNAERAARAHSQS